jgi:ribosome-associated toxin RatA of RatAB toxin-antitoxin module
VETVTCSREIDRSAETVRAALDRFPDLTRAAGFDDVTVLADDPETVRVRNRVGLAELELTLRRIDTEVALGYEQTDGLFDEMTTHYEVDSLETGRCRVGITTEFTIREGLLGDVLDTTVVHRRRESELTAQLDWLADGAPEPP